MARLVSGAVGLLVRLVLVMVVSAVPARNNLYRYRNDLWYGNVYPDGVDYIDFAVDDATVGVTVSVTRVQQGGDCGRQCDAELELFLRYGAFPTQANHDQRVVASLTKRGEVVVEQLRTGRYFVLISGGQLLDSSPVFVGSRAELQYSLNITYATCERNEGNGSSRCPLGTATDALVIAPPALAYRSQFPGEYYKPTSRILGGCVDVQRQMLVYSFRMEEPQWDLTLTLSTTFAAGFRMTAFTNFRNLTEVPRSDILESTEVLQSVSILPGAGFRSATVHFTAPPKGRWVVVISGNLTDNSTCAHNGGAAFALETRHATNCSSGGVGSNSPPNLTLAPDGIDLCILEFVPLDRKRESIGAEDNALDSTFSSEEMTIRDYGSSDQFAVGYRAIIDSGLAGAYLELKVTGTTNVQSFQVLARVDALPTPQQFDLKFRTSETISVTPLEKVNISSNVSVDAHAYVWKPVMYPRTGAWYFLLIPDESDYPRLEEIESNQLALKMSLHTYACPTREQDACSGNGKCKVALSANGKSYSSCRCSYGYAGDQCESLSVDRTYRGTQIFFTMASNLAILPVTWLCLRRQLYAESLLFAATATISTLYHACDFDFFCSLGHSDLRRLEHALSFNMIAVLVVHLSGARNQLKAGLLVFYLLSMVLLTTDEDPSSSTAWIMLASASLVQFTMAISYYVIVGSTRMGLGKSIALRTFLFYSKNFDRRYGIAGFVLLAIALSCWFTASNSSYWILHSLWHVSAMLAAFCLIGLRLNDRYQLVTPDFNIDVLATPPQFRFAVSSVKSVDILEDMSDSGHGHRRMWRR